MGVLVLFIVMIITIIVLWLIATVKDINKDRAELSEIKSGLENHVQLRHDYLKSMIELASSYAGQGMVESVELMVVGRNITVDEINECIKNQRECMEKLYEIGDNHNVIRSAQPYLELCIKVSLENMRIAEYGRHYNKNAAAFNKFVFAFPDSIVYVFMGFDCVKYIEESNLCT